MTDSVEDLMQLHRQAMAEEASVRLTDASNLIANFVDFAEKIGVQLNSSSFSYVPTIGIVAGAPNLAKIILGSIATERDGLFATNNLTKNHEHSVLLPGYYSSQDYMLMAHPYFRREMQEMANFAPRFVEQFWEFEQDGVEKYVAIDEDRLRINVDSSAYLEEDTWYGAPFDEDIDKVPLGIGKLRPPSDLDAILQGYFFANAYCLDFKWSQQGHIKTFQALEIKSAEVQLVINGEQYFPARYLHAEFDLSTGSFRHFDGAVQLFREDEYLLRRDSDFNVNDKYLTHVKARSKKLFKLNGQVSVKTWVELCCNFFTGNPLVFEYFTGQYPNHVVDILEKLRARRERDT